MAGLIISWCYSSTLVITSNPKNSQQGSLSAGFFHKSEQPLPVSANQNPKELQLSFVQL